MRQAITKDRLIQLNLFCFTYRKLMHNNPDTEKKMHYKSILTLINNTERCADWSGYALDLASQHGADITGIAAREPVSALTLGELVPTDSSWISDLQKRVNEDAKIAVEKFEAQCLKADIDQFDATVVDDTELSAMQSEAFTSDLLVVGQYLEIVESGGIQPGFVESLIFSSGRPVLVVPAVGEYSPVIEKALVAWSDTRESSIAIHAAIPQLQTAEEVEILTIVPPENRLAEWKGFEKMERYLTRHNVNASFVSVETSQDIGNTILSHAGDIGAELLVMGAYGHTRLKDWVMGGVTKTILGSMTLPVLTAH